MKEAMDVKTVGENAVSKTMEPEEGAPLVSIAIVFFNAMPWLPGAVESCLKQTFQDFELLLLDDGSTDGSLEFARGLNSPKVRVYSDGINRKLNVRLNESIRLARGRYYARMDADDLMFPWRIEHQVALLNRYGSCFIGGGAIVIDGSNNVVGARGLRPQRVRSLGDARHLFIHPTVMAPTELFRRNLYSENFLFHRSQDAELWTRIWRNEAWIHDPKPVLFYRDAGGLSVENYFGTALGVCAIGYHSGELGKFAKSWWCTRELLKCIVVVTAAIWGAHGVITRRRNQLIPREALPDVVRAREVLGL